MAFGAPINKADTIVVARLGKSGVPNLARPCLNCWKLITKTDISTIIYTTDTGYSIEKIYR